MGSKDMAIFRTLLTDEYLKTFGEPLTKIPHSKAHLLAWLIEGYTSIILIYRSLTNYTNAVL